MTYCPGCLEKQRQIDELKEEIVRLKAQQRYQARTAKEGAFGSSTPSSKIPVKPSTLQERQERRGGGKVGHRGHGRRAVAAEQADRIETVTVPEFCPDCGASLQDKGTRTRTVMECQPVRMEPVIYRLERKRCPRCGRVVQARAPGVLPRGLYGNQLLSHVAVEHYLNGATLGQLERQTGIGCGSLVNAMHQLAGWLQDVPAKLIEEYRPSFVKHADETGWRTDGQNGYAWLFCTIDISIWRFRKTRSAAVPQEIFGPERLPGNLVVDRYAAYNQAWCSLQYCYAHLNRDVEDLEKDFPGHPEVKCFVGSLVPLLSSAMSLRGLPISDREFQSQAADIKKQIIAVVEHPAQHPAIQTMQDLFREKGNRMYRWARDRRIPADNNLAERELRPLVIARKVSFGSQSEAGAKTREILMTVLHTLKKRTTDVFAAFKSALDQLAENPKANLYKLLFSVDSS